MIDLYNGDCYGIIKQIPDKSIDLILTDPPYKYGTGGIGRSEIGHRAAKLRHEIDYMSSGYDYSIFNEFLRVCKIPNMLIFCSNLQLHPILDFFHNYDKLSSTVLVWCKTNPPPLNIAVYKSNLEFCVYVRGKNVTFNFGNVPSEYLNKYYVSKVIQGKEKVHPAQKPIELITRYISVHSKPNDVVLDPFMGSGTTGIVCKKLHRDFIGIELDTDIYNVAKNRIDGANTIKPLF